MITIKQTRIPLFAFVMFALTACTANQGDKQTLQAALKQADIYFSNTSVKDGMGKAFVQFADSNLVKLNDGMLPIIGKEKLARVYDKDKSHFPFTLQWAPEKTEVAISGDLGYTYGNWKMTAKTAAGKDTAYYGNYVTVWKKQADGSWKYVLDGGNNTPDPNHK